jgi:hypothetical protein
LNFFGHAVAAQAVDDDPAFLLGAMAPDLLPLCGAVAGPETSPRVAAGQAHHLWVDAIFHANPVFTAMQAWTARSLVERGVGRGPARGAAHVGIELFLDGELARRGPPRRAYERSLVDAETTGAPFIWPDDASRERWRSLVVRLRGGTLPDAYRDPRFVADRLVGALSRRPRLALADREAGILRDFLPTLGARVSDEAQALVGSIVTLTI